MARDLSLDHAPVSNLFSQPSNDAERARYQITEQQVEQFRQQGFLPGIRLLNAEQVEALRVELANLVQADHDGAELWYEYHSNESGDPSAILFHALGAWRIKPGMHDLLWNPALLEPAKQLLEGPVRFWHDQLFCKPAHDGGVVAWHQDYSYWTRTRPMAHLTCWIGLDDATTENGCIQYVPGSHRWPLLPTTNLAKGMDAILDVLTPEQRAEFTPVPCELKAGEAVFHHPLMLHGSYENRSPRPRRAVVINLFRDGTLSDSDKPLLTGVDVIPRGEKMSGRFFPLLP
ncbi:phytanoyl-CoA dioxygenase family protein [Lacipirellula parvula]|uniref:Phytanoyl-CoA dioxygenase n=1 Tax=Lacipirellula parvula TaxID=2650471 RepID=A0A5K7XB21_9BACT|nr:phytanoyl-CoA dioxygenase family protein [Lacipirellula parvula]BBO32011.1 phytanoyl-CoA dioxygenase [Lacipirellula parvula]